MPNFAKTIANALCVWAIVGSGAYAETSMLSPTWPRQKSACSLGMPQVPLLPPTIQGEETYTTDMVGADLLTARWAAAFMALQSTARVSEDAANEAKKLLVQYATEQPLQWKRGGGTNGEATLVFVTLRVGMLLALEAHFQRDRLSSEEANAVRAWLKQLIKQVSRTRTITQVEVNNKHHMLAVMAYAFGYAMDDEAEKNRALKIFRQTLREMRKDGSIPADARRGGSAVHYTNIAVANLVTLAELAALDGRNLYAEQSGGKTLDLAIEFLLKSTNDTTLIAPYATEVATGKAGLGGARQDLSWRSDGMAGWTRYYLARFPNSPNAELIRSVTSEYTRRSVYLFEAVGGNARCLSGQS